MKLRFAYVTLFLSFIFLFFHFNVIHAQTSLPSCTSVLANEGTRNACFSDDDFKSQVEDFLSLYNGAGNGCLLNGTTFTSVADFINDHPDLIYARLLEFQGAACPGFLNMAQGHFIGQCKCNLDNEAKTNNDFKKEIQQRFIEVVTNTENPVELSGTPIIVPTSIPVPTTIIPFPTDTGLGLQTDGEMQIYGDTCGVAGVPGKNKCCLTQIPTAEYTAPLWVEDQVMDVIKVGVNILINKINLFSKAVILNTYDVSQKVGSISNPYCFTGKPSSYKSGGTQNPFNDQSCICEEDTTGSGGAPNEQICYDVFDTTKSNAEYAQCLTCYSGGGGVWTALGCVKTDFSTFITQTVFGTGISIAGLVALLCIIYSSFLMQTSKGNPEQITKAQEMLTSCITGLIMIIFSVLILRFIGVDLLRIPGIVGSGSDSTSEATATPTPGSGIISTVSGPSDSSRSAPVPTIKPTIAPVVSTPTPKPTTVSTLASTPTEIPTPTNTPVPTPTATRSATLGEFDCDRSSTNGPLPNEVYLYDDTNYKGACVRLTAGKQFGLQTLNNKEAESTGWWFGHCNKFFNDCIASFQVGSDVKVTLYQDPVVTADPASGGCKVTRSVSVDNLDFYADANTTSTVNCARANLLDQASYAVVEER